MVIRRVATVQAALRDATIVHRIGPWVETHGYHHVVATRRANTTVGTKTPLEMSRGRLILSKR
jgi:hypothetical protein